MVDFFNVGDTVEINIDSDSTVIVVKKTLEVYVDDQRPYVYLDEDANLKSVGSYLKFLVTDINGRPSDDAVEVGQWLRDTYFTGVVPTSGGGGGGGDASAANQITMIGELQDIEVDVEAVSTKLDTVNTNLSDIESDLEDIKFQNFIVGEHDEREIAYVTSGNGIGEIETVTFKLATVTVNTLTFTYDSNDNLTDVVLT